MGWIAETLTLPPSLLVACLQVKKPIECSAPEYVEYLMDWIETQLDDENCFPQQIGGAGGRAGGRAGGGERVCCPCVCVAKGTGGGVGLPYGRWRRRNGA